MKSTPAYYPGSAIAPADTSKATSVKDILQVIGLILLARGLWPFLANE